MDQRRKDAQCYHCERFDWQCDGESMFISGFKYHSSQKRMCLNQKNSIPTKSPLQVQGFHALYRRNLEFMSHIEAFADAIVATCDDTFAKLKAQPDGLLGQFTGKRTRIRGKDGWEKKT